MRVAAGYYSLATLRRNQSALCSRVRLTRLSGRIQPADSVKSGMACCRHFVPYRALFSRGSRSGRLVGGGMG